MSTTAESSAPPPGYADPRAPTPEVDHERPLAAFAVLLVAALVGAAHEIDGRLLIAYLAPGFGPPLWAGGCLSGAGLLLGALSVRRRRDAALSRLPWLVIALSIATGASAPALAAAFAAPRAFAFVALAVPAVAGVLVGATGVTAWQAFGDVAARLGVLPRLLDPFRLLALLALLGAGALTTSRIGLERGALAVALVLATLAAGSSPLAAQALGERLPRARAATLAALACFAACAGAFVWLERTRPLAELHRYVNEIVYARQGARQRFVITSGQENFELYIDGKLKVSDLDSYRYFEALVHPAMLAARPHARVLVLGSGDGMTERELLRYPDVASVTSVVVDRAGADVASSVPWLRAVTADSMRSARVHVVEAEPIVWLAQGDARFDVVIVDLPDPLDYVDSKNFTRAFYKRLARRLAPGGVAVVQATSPFAAPRTFASIERTLQAAGFATLPYHAAVTTFGDWGFVLCASAPVRQPHGQLPAGLRFLDARALDDLFVMPADMRAPGTADVITLDDQHVVGLFADERRRLGM